MRKAFFRLWRDLNLRLSTWLVNVLATIPQGRVLKNTYNRILRLSKLGIDAKTSMIVPQTMQERKNKVIPLKVEHIS